MAGWDHRRPPRASSRWQPPGIFFNVEFGVSFSPDHRTHTTRVEYTSRRMEERLHEERMRRQHEGGQYHQEQPGELQQLATLGALMPGPEAGESTEWLEVERPTRHQQYERQRRLGVSTREQHERGVSAPPDLTERIQLASSTVHYIPHIAPIQHTRSMPLEYTDTRSLLEEWTDQPLPPSPSQFRLGEDNMPWSMPAWDQSLDQPVFASSSSWHPSPEQPGFASPSRSSWRPSPEQPDFAAPAVLGTNQETYRTEDPQRVRELETLQQAMMTVDSLGHDGWEPGTWGSVEEVPRGTRSIGWAVSSRDSDPTSPPVPAPPPYVVSQWERSHARASVQRPRSAYS